MDTKRDLGAFLIAAFTAASVHAADTSGCRWSVSLQGGLDVEVAGDVVGAAQGAIAGLPTTVSGLSYRAGYDRAFRGSLSVARRVAPRVEVFVRGSRYVMNGRSSAIGGASGLDVTSSPGRYREWTAEAGFRYRLGGGRGWAPFVGLAGGARVTSAVPLTLAVPAAGLEAADVPFLGGSTVAVFGVDGGVERRVSRHLGLEVGVGLRYQGAPSALDSGLQGSGLETLNDGASRWSLPVSAAITLRF